MLVGSVLRLSLDFFSSYRIGVTRLSEHCRTSHFRASRHRTIQSRTERHISPSRRRVVRINILSWIAGFRECARRAATRHSTAPRSASADDRQPRSMSCAGSGVADRDIPTSPRARRLRTLTRVVRGRHQSNVAPVSIRQQCGIPQNNAVLNCRISRRAPEMAGGAMSLACLTVAAGATAFFQRRAASWQWRWPGPILPMLRRKAVRTRLKTI